LNSGLPENLPILNPGLSARPFAHCVVALSLYALAITAQMTALASAMQRAAKYN